MHHHSGEGAEFLTAEAFYTLFSVDDRLVIDHFYCLRGADLLALLAALAKILLDHGLGFKGDPCDLAEELGLVVEKQTALDGDIFVIGDHHRVGVTENLHSINVIGNETALASRLKRRDLAFGKTDDLRADHIQHVWTF